MNGLRKKLNRKQLLRLLVVTALVLVGLLTALAGGRGPNLETNPPTDPPNPTLAANPYGPNDFQYQGDYLTCIAGESRLGIDVSEFQRQIDWQAVKNAGVTFAIIRLGYRGNLEGQLYEDALFRQNLRQARDAGIQVGVYFFSQAVSEAEAIEEAEFVLEILDGKKLDLPVVFDWEFMYTPSRTDNVDGPTMTACAKAFCRTIRQAGYEAMIYFNLNQAQNYLDLTALSAYPFWLAMYSDRMTFPHQVDFWQYSYTGRVPGIETDVDLNLWFPYEE